MRDTVAILLAAGVGSRLRPYTDDRPKCLVPLGEGETILSRAVRVLAGAGVARLIVVTGYLEERVREALAQCPLPVEFAHNKVYRTTQNVVSLHSGLERVQPGEAVLKLDGDVVFDPEVLAALANAPGEMRVAVDRSGALGAEEMKVRVDAGGRVTAFGKGLDPAGAYGESIGVEWIARDVVDVVKSAITRAVWSGGGGLYYEDVYNDVLDKLDVRAVEVDPRWWTEIDDAADLERARASFGRGR